ncbi:hypothetical protein O3P69_017841 [Scylla paramamosain]|uniref:Uncharacterized protein n=1 Tax=Scylla paramamosain TaxID=85552 RepID=A0AAW0THN7_SCYPA
MPAATLATVTLLCLSAVTAQRLVVVHDHLFDFSPSGIRQQDLHAKTALASIAASLNLTLAYHFVERNTYPKKSVVESKDVAGVVGAGVCRLGKSVASLAQSVKVPSLLLEVLEPCKYDPPLPASVPVLPLYSASISRRFPCLVHVSVTWLRITLGLTSLSPYPSPLLPAYPNPRAEYLRCAREELSDDAAQVEEEGTVWRIQLERARRYLNGRKLTVATIERAPFVKLEMVGEEIVGATGFCIEMLDEMARKFNFTYRLVLPYDGNWGAPMNNGTFNGMVGMVHRKTVDFAMAGFTITHIRETVIDFTHAFFEEPTTILIPPPREQNNFLAFLEPFSWQVWFLTLVSIMVVGPIMWILATVGNLPVLYPHNTRTVHYSLFRYTWDCAFALAGQSARTRHTQPVRVLHGMWWTFAVILIYTYTGTLIAFLTVPRLTSLINSLEELANQKDVLWTYRAKTAHETLFATAEPPSTYHKIGQLLKERPDLLVHTDNEGISAVLRGDTAFIKEKSWLDFAMERDYLATKQCRMAQVNQLFFSAGFGWALQERSIFLQLFNNEILRMSQSGLFTIWRMQNWPSPNECTAGNPGAPAGPKSLHIKNFSGHFFIYGVGLGSALLAFLVERLLLRGLFRDAESEGLQALLLSQESLRNRRRRHDILRPGPLERLLQMRVVALKNGPPLVTVNPQPTPRHPDIFDLHSPDSQVYHIGVIQVRGRPPIR